MAKEYLLEDVLAGEPTTEDARLPESPTAEYLMEDVVAASKAPPEYLMEDVVKASEAPPEYLLEDVVAAAKPPPKRDVGLGTKALGALKTGWKGVDVSLLMHQASVGQIDYEEAKAAKKAFQKEAAKEAPPEGLFERAIVGGVGMAPAMIRGGLEGGFPAGVAGLAPNL